MTGEFRGCEVRGCEVRACEVRSARCKVRGARVRGARCEGAIAVLVIIVRFEIDPEFEDVFLRRVMEQAAVSLRLERDCLQFDVCRDPGIAHHVLLYEIYASDAAFEAHLLSDHFLQFDRDTRRWVVSKTVERWRRVTSEGVGR